MEELLEVLEARQLVPRPTSTSAILSAKRASCTGFTLPVYGVISIDSTRTITLTSDAIFKPACTVEPGPAIIANGASGTNAGLNVGETATGPQFSDFRDAFYASTFPQCYALAATTVIAYMLVIMLVITPRSFLDGGVVFLGRRGHGFSKGPSGGLSIGGRPWLQKVAALTVAISLTIATAETFRVAEEQYSWGIENAKTIQAEVMNGTLLKVIRLISDTFLWLAQAQTLIRLFPRQREKVIIKWTAFALISLDLIFGAINSFQYDTKTRPGNFVEPVPALSYLFQLSLGLLYAAWVIYYAITKKRFAFYHEKMRNMILVSLLSIVSLLVPVVFFILDISKPELASWGDYVRWVGAAAASVVVWEWVERIEALEREEKKDGILGREVFDGDEMIHVSSSEFAWPRKRKGKREKDGDDDEEGGAGPGLALTNTGRSNIWPAMSSIATRYGIRPNNNSQSRPNGQGAHRTAQNDRNGATRFLQPPLWPSRPAPAVTPVSRTETASADSTIYRVRYQTLTESTSAVPQGGATISRSNSAARSQPAANDDDATFASHNLNHQSQSPVPGPSGVIPTPPPNPEQTGNDSGSENPSPAGLPRPQPTPSTSEHPATTISPAPTAGNRSRIRWHAITANTTGPLFRRANRDPPAELMRGTTAATAPAAASRSGTTPQSAYALNAAATAGSAASSFQEGSSAHPPSDMGTNSRGGPASAGASSPPPANGNSNNNGNRWDIRGRLEDFAANQAEKIRERIRPTPDTGSLTLTVIPAPPRPGDTLARLVEEDERAPPQHRQPQRHHPAVVTGPSAAQMMGILGGTEAVVGSSPTAAAVGVARSNSSGSTASSSSPATAAVSPASARSPRQASFRVGTGSGVQLRHYVIPAPQRPDATSPSPTQQQDPRAMSPPR